MRDVNSELQEVINKLFDKLEQIKILNKEVADLGTRKVALEYGVTIGDIVEYEGKRGVITNIDHEWPRITYYKGFAKEGELMKREHRVYQLSELKVIERGVKA